MIDAAKRGQHLRAVEFPVQWTSRPLEFTHRSVAVHGDKKSIPAFARLLEVTDVSGVEEVEAAIGEHELLSRGRILFAEGFQIVMGDKLIHQNMGDVGDLRGKKILLFSTPENSLGFMRCLPRPQQCHFSPVSAWDVRLVFQNTPRVRSISSAKTRSMKNGD